MMVVYQDYGGVRWNLKERSIKWGRGSTPKKWRFTLSPMRSVHLVEDMTGAECFSAGTVEETRDPILGKTLYRWDFSGFGTPGQYRVVAEGV